MSGIITEPMFLQQFPQMEPMNKSGAIQALVVAIYEIGCLMGSLVFVGYGDKLGRRRAVLIGTLIMLIGAAIQTSSFTLAQLIVGRIVTGAGNGMNTSSIPVWQSEIAPPKIRGFLVLFEGALITGGVMLSYWINYGFWFVTQYDSFQWRYVVSCQKGRTHRLMHWQIPNRVPGCVRLPPHLRHPAIPGISSMAAQAWKDRRRRGNHGKPPRHASRRREHPQRHR